MVLLLCNKNGKNTFAFSNLKLVLRNEVSRVFLTFAEILNYNIHKKEKQKDTNTFYNFYFPYFFIVAIF
jgi:hypothetical protein